MYDEGSAIVPSAVLRCLRHCAEPHVRDKEGS